MTGSTPAKVPAGRQHHEARGRIRLRRARGKPDRCHDPATRLRNGLIKHDGGVRQRGHHQGPTTASVLAAVILLAGCGGTSDHSPTAPSARHRIVAGRRGNHTRGRDQRARTWDTRRCPPRLDRETRARGTSWDPTGGSGAPNKTSRHSTQGCRASRRLPATTAPGSRTRARGTSWDPTGGSGAPNKTSRHSTQGCRASRRLPGDDRAWIENTCPRDIMGPDRWKRCVERDLRALQGGSPEFDRPDVVRTAGHSDRAGIAPPLETGTPAEPSRSRQC